jgi:carboxyl-terminal processing protease
MQGVFYLVVFLFLIHGNGLSQAGFRQQSKALQDTLSRYHYTGKAIDQQFSQQLFDDFINEIDPDKFLLTEQDIESVKKFRNTLTVEFADQSSSFLTSFRELLRTCLNRKTSYLNRIATVPVPPILPTTVELMPAGVETRSTTFELLQKRWDDDLRISVFQQAFEYAISDSVDLEKVDGAFFEKTEPKARQLVIKKERRKVSRVLNQPEGFEAFIDRFFLNSFAMQFDPNSSYLTKAELEKFMASFSKEGFSAGIVMVEDRDGQFTINTIVPGSPAWRSGQLNPFDRLISLSRGNEEIDLTESSMGELQQILNSESKFPLEIGVKKQNGSIKKVTIKPEKIQLDENIVRGYAINGTKKIGYIALPGFYTSEGEAQEGLQCANDVAKEIIKLKTESIEGLILDLRNNGGGSLGEALAMAGIFIDEGPLGLLKGRAGNSKTLKDGNRGIVYDGPMIVMVNALSASASEFLASAMQDYNRAIIVGSKTYGKGSAQIVIPLDNQKDPIAFAKVTTNKIYRVTGSSVQERGLVPTIQLPDFLHSLNLTEQFQKYHLPFDSISKKITYAKLPIKANIKELIKKSEDRVQVSRSFLKLKELIEWFDKYNSSREKIESWSSYLHSVNEVQTKFKDIETLAMQQPLEILNTASDTKINKADRFRDELNQRYLGELKHDFYLHEACIIMTDYLSQLKAN